MIRLICGITPGALDVADEDVAVGAEGDDALLDAGPAGVVDADHGRADLRGQVHDLAHLLCHHLAERAAEDREVLGEDEHGPAVDRAVARDHGVTIGRRCLAMSELVVRWRTKMSSSSNEPGSSSCSIRSRAVSLPFACCFSTASSEAGVDRLVSAAREAGRASPRRSRGSFCRIGAKSRCQGPGQDGLSQAPAGTGSRRIAKDRRPPAGQDQTRAGISTSRWEGKA